LLSQVPRQYEYLQLFQKHLWEHGGVKPLVGINPVGVKSITKFSSICKFI
jgi:hypothetical protein